MSATPHEKPLWVSHWFTIFCKNDRTFLQPSGPLSNHVKCNNDPLLAPIVFLHTMPLRSSPFKISTLQSLAAKSGSSFLFFEAIAESRRMSKFSGSNFEKICFPVHNSFGLRIEGIGNWPSHTGSHMRMFIAKSFSMYVSRFVYLAVASKLSCTTPITGLLPCGDTSILGFNIMCLISDRDSIDCPKCKFISSPSKSALYGDVTARLNRRVEKGMTLTRCPIMDILWSEGCRLKMM
mmetsp:Transcript_41397/g.119133  ORF Transcript_41397/g.119133 Transcript_41397/m.119133 type:complete len:236 (-) Transcript_41397:1413-2120(-)